MILNETELKELAEVIRDVETRTSGELRLIIVRKSSVHSPAFPLLSLMLACASLVYLWSARHLLMLSDTTWILPIVLGGALVLGYLFSRMPSVRRQLTWGDDLEHQVLMRAELEFHREGLSQTQYQTGILLFISLYERRAVVLADKGIASKFPPEIWNETIELITQGVRKKRLREHLEKAIRMCGELLAREFPIKSGDRNELPNHVLIK